MSAQLKENESRGTSGPGASPEWPAPGSAQYRKHLQEEIEHYSRVFAGTQDRPPEDLRRLFQPVPASWIEVERRAAEGIRAATGYDLNGHITRALQRSQQARMVSLGSGPGGVELAIAQVAREARITCVDINAELLGIGREQARRDGLPIEFIVADLNTVSLPSNVFDVVLCHASLHHVVEVSRLAEEIKRSLRENGFLITVDVITPSCYAMWPETRAVVEGIWRTLPPGYRINHTAYAEPRVDETIWEGGAGLTGMECVRSADIVPALSKTLCTEHFVPLFSLCRRFFDTMYGPNYDLRRALDRAILDWIWELDVYYITSQQLRPETFFGVYRKFSG
jgi:SAM-dependent methyltransferase